MTYLTVTEAKAHLLDIIRRADKTMQHFIISRNGKPRAIIMSIDEYESWMETLEVLSDGKTMRDIEIAQKELAEGKYCTIEEVFKKKAKKKK